jgi:hypothetical protein
MKLGLEKLNFQILRRSYATLAVGERKGTTRDVQTMLRHTRPDTTLENYVKDVPESVYAMGDAMYEQIAGPLDEKQGLAMIQAPGGRAVTGSNLACNCTHSEHASQGGLRNSLKIGAPGEIRTPDLLLRRQSLYPSELRAR